MNESKSLNPFKESLATESLMTVESSRAIEEVQAAMVIAKKFPRDQAKSVDNILNACTRVSLAESAVYAYPRGGKSVTGPSIRLAEAIAQNWGNIQYGIKELSQSNGSSQVEAFAWDIETNTRQVKIFNVPHKRYKGGGNVSLVDPRDIYEMTANMGARRLRSCILGIIPGDVTEAAVKQTEMTLANSMGAPEEQIEKLIDAFSAYGVTKEMLSKRLRKNLKAVIIADVISLKQVYQSIKDEMGKPSDYFEMESSDSSVDNIITGNKNNNQENSTNELVTEG